MLVNYEEYANEALKKIAGREASRRRRLVGEVSDLKPERVLDLGCGAGHELLPFLEKKFARGNLKITGALPDDNPQTPSFYVVKMAVPKMFVTAQIFGEYAFTL